MPNATCLTSLGGYAATWLCGHVATLRPSTFLGPRICGGPRICEGAPGIVRDTPGFVRDTPEIVRGNPGFMRDTPGIVRDIPGFVWVATPGFVGAPEKSRDEE